MNHHLVDGPLTLTVGDRFLSVVCLDGSATVNGEPMEKGDSFFLPAGLGEVTITGQFRIIVTEKPSPKKTHRQRKSAAPIGEVNPK